MAEIDVRLSPNSIQNAIKQLEAIKHALSTVGDEASKELADKTLDQVKKNYAGVPFESSNEPPTFKVIKDGNSYKAVASSSGIVYEEFGTGDVGANNPHPRHGDYGLKGYNTGPKIRPADAFSKRRAGITSGKYWVYTDGAGNTVLTQGIPSGKFMYNASEWLRDNYKDIVKKKVDDALSKR